jgi:hypothetical protein
MTNKIENFNRPFPCSLILENFFHRNGFDVERFATVRRSNSVLEFRNLSRLHSSISLPMSSHLTEYGICGMKFSKICALTVAPIVACGIWKSATQSTMQIFAADHMMP